MVKKDRKSEINESDVEAAGIDSSENTGESTPSDTNSQEVSEQISDDQESESPSEALLDDVRRSLIEEEEVDKTKKEAKWWHRLGRKTKSTEPEPPPPPVEIDLPATLLQTERVEDQEQATVADDYVEEIDNLINTLESEERGSRLESSAVLPEADLGLRLARVGLDMNIGCPLVIGFDDHLVHELGRRCF